MTDREKLIELLHDDVCEGKECPECPYSRNDDLCIAILARKMADHLIANGVTVRDNGKPLESFLHPVDAYKGLKEKYLVFKADTGEKVENCLVLRPDKDSAAVVALRAYAESTDNATLANDIYCWVGKGTNVPSGWTPVTEGLPEPETDVLVYIGGNIDTLSYRYNRTGRLCFMYRDESGYWREPICQSVNCWMPLLEPPEEVTK